MRVALLAWIHAHPHVIPSPFQNDTLLIKNAESGEKEPVPKLLLECSIRELHNDLAAPPASRPAS